MNAAVAGAGDWRATVWPASEPGAGTSPAVSVIDLQPSWTARFRVEAEVLRVALAPLNPEIEHVGSTAVPGLSARPVVDMMIGVDQPAAVVQQQLRLANFGYAVVLPGTAPLGARLVRRVRGITSHQVFVLQRQGPMWQRMLRFRELLREDRALAEDYDTLKRQLAGLYPNDDVAYASAKAAFVRAVLGVAG